MLDFKHNDYYRLGFNSRHLQRLDLDPHGVTNTLRAPLTSVCDAQTLPLENPLKHVKPCETVAVG